MSAAGIAILDERRPAVVWRVRKFRAQLAASVSAPVPFLVCSELADGARGHCRSCNDPVGPGELRCSACRKALAIALGV